MPQEFYVSPVTRDTAVPAVGTVVFRMDERGNPFMVDAQGVTRYIVFSDQPPVEEVPELPPPPSLRRAAVVGERRTAEVRTAWERLLNDD